MYVEQTLEKREHQATNVIDMIDFQLIPIQIQLSTAFFTQTAKFIM